MTTMWSASGVATIEIRLEHLDVGDAGKWSSAVRVVEKRRNEAIGKVRQTSSNFYQPLSGRKFRLDGWQNFNPLALRNFARLRGRVLIC
jgi:hypothetical protein